MKPTIPQIIAHFQLPEQALHSQEIRAALDSVSDAEWDEAYDMEIAMNVFEWSFRCEWDCPLVKWFEVNHESAH